MTCLKSVFTPSSQVSSKAAGDREGRGLVFVMCVGPGGDVDRDVHLELKHGVEAKNYDDVSILCVYVLEG